MKDTVYVNYLWISVVLALFIGGLFGFTIGSRQATISGQAISARAPSAVTGISQEKQQVIASKVLSSYQNRVEALATAYMKGEITLDQLTLFTGEELSKIKNWDLIYPGWKVITGQLEQATTQALKDAGVPQATIDNILEATGGVSTQ